MLRPRGATFGDGLRLATINVVAIIVALAIIGLAALLNHALDWVLPLPFLFTGFFVIIALVAGAVLLWYRYATAHGRAVRARGREAQPDIFGAIGALPFVGAGLVLLGSGLFALLRAMISLSAGRAGDAIIRLGYGVLFLGLTVVVVVVARAAAD